MATKTKAELEQELARLQKQHQEICAINAAIIPDWNNILEMFRSLFQIEMYRDESDPLWHFRDSDTEEHLSCHTDIAQGFAAAIKKRVMVPDRGMLDSIQKYTSGTDLTYLANQFIIPLWLTAFQSSQHEAEQLQQIVASCYNRDGTV